MRAAYHNGHSQYQSYHGGQDHEGLAYAKNEDGRHYGFVRQTSAGTMALIEPHLFNYSIPRVLEHVLLRALALDPAERYSTVLELVEALQSEEVRMALVEAAAPADDARGASRVGRVVDWLKRELNE
jgi:hypothetical protein